MGQGRQAAEKEAESLGLELALLDQVKDAAQKIQGQGGIAPHGQADVGHQPEAPQQGGDGPLAPGQDEGAVNYQGGQGGHQGSQDPDGVAPVEQQKSRHQDPVEQQQGVAERGHGEIAIGPGALQQDQGMPDQARGQGPGAPAAQAVPLRQEKSQPQDGGPRIGRQGKV